MLEGWQKARRRFLRRAGVENMPFVLIKGTFRPETGVPDGDTIRFQPDDPDLLFRLRQSGRPPKIHRKSGTTVLRYEGVDALEPTVGLPFSTDAAKANLECLGRSDVDQGVRGHILARQLGPEGRPIAFVFLRDTLEIDGERTFLSTVRLRESVNYRMLRLGHVYPLYYDTLFDDLRETLTEAVGEARAVRRGVWTQDATNSGVQWSGAPSLGTLKPLLPKIWRRLDAYTRDDDFERFSDSLDQFAAFLETRDDRVKLAGSSHFMGLDNILRIDGETLCMEPRPEEVVFRA